MSKLDNILNPFYAKKNGITLGFILSYLFCSDNFNKPISKVIYFMHIANFIDLKKINKSEITNEYLLKIIFNYTKNKKLIQKSELREATGLTSRDTFNKYFGEHLISCDLENKRIFTLSETFEILQFWQDDDKWGRLKAFTKKELAFDYLKSSYDDLELKMTNEMFDYDYYKNHDLIKPADAKKFILKYGDDIAISKIKDDVDGDYLDFFFHIFLIHIILSGLKKHYKSKKSLRETGLMINQKLYHSIAI